MYFLANFSTEVSLQHNDGIPKIYTYTFNNFYFSFPKSAHKCIFHTCFIWRNYYTYYVLKAFLVCPLMTRTRIARILWKIKWTQTSDNNCSFSRVCHQVKYSTISLTNKVMITQISTFFLLSQRYFYCRNGRRIQMWHNNCNARCIILKYILPGTFLMWPIKVA